MNQNLLLGVEDVMAAAIATGLLSGTCTIQEWDGTLGASGAPDKSNANWDNVTGLVDIACMSAPLAFGDGMDATEAKSMADILAMQPLHVLLDAYYPTIESGMRAVLTGPNGTLGTNDILGVEWDSQQIMTRLKVRRAKI